MSARPGPHRSRRRSLWRKASRSLRENPIDWLVLGPAVLGAILGSILGTPWAVVPMACGVLILLASLARKALLFVHDALGSPFTRGVPRARIIERQQLERLASALGLRGDPDFPNHAEGLYEGRALALCVDYQGVHASLLTPIRDSDITSIGGSDLTMTCSELEEIARGDLSGVDARLYALYGEALSGAQRDTLLDALQEFPGAELKLWNGEFRFGPLHPWSFAEHARPLIETMHQTLSAFERHPAVAPLSDEVPPHQYFCRKKLARIAKMLKGHVYHGTPDQADASYAGRDYVLALKDGRVAVTLSTTFRGHDLTIGSEGTFALARDYKVTSTDAGYALFESALDATRREALLVLLRAHPGAKLTLKEGWLRLWPVELSSLANKPTALVATLHKTLTALGWYGSGAAERVPASA